MRETSEEIAELQRLLDAAYGRSTEHLRSIVTEQRRLDAQELTQVLTGMCTLNLATVTATGEPRISAVDGHFLHARWVFSTSGSAAKARHLRARPAASVSYVDGERIGVFSHGRVEFLTDQHPDFQEIEDHLVAHYGSSPSSWGDDIVYCRLQPHWMVGYAFDKSAVLPG
ncbi:pyridoxamine 5'-phosphate oxidase-related FMN- binding protein [Kribbella flavida DSM 17836]|uniref:Pyridoxamine 5'-phosphate oxidase-related FMN-binding protein n=1 Tax=Kribbella flavida (strain DSM 17836 / JCM 10339 / NBRC 14399) TaxID=479435 RepID=D2PUY3_KRIFD|nr:pyridoxamine 5'-phosphate oxidase family protein [Kribbella flavida]ADB31449.1 pyridoxamine 5'-phosphate oxidase-related FMN- binding protein [Kribbella flavida DSM 17836]